MYAGTELVHACACLVMFYCSGLHQAEIGNIGNYFQTTYKVKLSLKG